MQQTAENVYQLDDHRPVVKADTKEGFIMLASTINAELGKFGIYRLNGRERALIDCVIQKTFGFKKKADWISEGQFAEFMGLSEGTTGNINKIKNALIKRKILFIDGRKIGINTIISEWAPYQNQSKTTENKTSQKRLSNQSNLTNEQSKTTEKAVESDLHKRKETITKETNTKETAYAFAGKTVRLNQKDFEICQNQYSNLSLTEELKQLDLELHGEKKWWSVMHAKLNYRNKSASGQLKAKGRSPSPENFSRTNYGEIKGSF